MEFQGRPGPRRSQALEFIYESCRAGDDDCHIFSYPQQRISFGGKTKTPQWVACRTVNGMPPEGSVPVRVCRVPGCVNGHHFKWGTLEESLASRVFKDRSGSRNPNAKLNWDAVREIRDIHWGKDFSLGISRPRGKSFNDIVQAEQKRVAAKYGITTSTLRNVVAGYIWKEKAKDEF